MFHKVDDKREMTVWYFNLDACSIRFQSADMSELRAPPTYTSARCVIGVDFVKFSSKFSIKYKKYITDKYKMRPCIYWKYIFENVDHHWRPCSGWIVLTYRGLGDIDLVNIGWGNGLVPDGTKQLPQPMLVDYDWSLVAFTWEQFYMKCSRTLSVTCIGGITLFEIIFRCQWVKSQIHHQDVWAVEWSGKQKGVV